MPEVRIECETKDSLPIEKLLEFQGELKELSIIDADRLKNEILSTGFAFPIYAWKSKGKNYVIGGHQRLRVLRAMKEEGIKVPDIPVVFVKAKDQIEAKRRVLQDVSQYGTITEKGVFEFAQSISLNFSDLQSFRLPDVDMSHLEANFFQQAGTQSEEYASSLILGTRNEAVQNAMLKPQGLLTCTDSPLDALPKSASAPSTECPRCRFRW